MDAEDVVDEIKKLQRLSGKIIESKPDHGTLIAMEAVNDALYSALFYAELKLRDVRKTAAT